MSRVLALALAALLSAGLVEAQELEKPVRLDAGGAPIDTEVGHAAPYVYDFDRDGKLDLLVGQFGGGKLRIYRNVGSDERPSFGDVEWFQVNGQVVTTPAG